MSKTLSFDVSTVVDHLHEGVQVIDPRFTYLYLNPAALKHAGLPAAELVGRRMMDVYPGIETTEMFGQLRRVMAEGGAHTMENIFTFPDGTRRAFELRMMRVPDGVVVLSNDVTARNDSEMRLRKAQRMEAVGQLAAGVAHDFNNLLTVIQSYGSFLSDAVAGDDESADDAATLLKAAASGAELTRKLLASSLQLPVTARAVSVADAVEGVHALLKRVIGEGIVLRTEVVADVGHVHVDPSALDQILMNLAINARDAMPTGGTLSISARPLLLDDEWAVRRGVTLQAGQHVVLSVSDTGTGIAPELQERIFEPFFSTKGEDRGTGLGLATCWGLASQAGGTITVYSEPGKGTTFSVYLPAAGADAQRAAASTATTSARPGATIVVVEDQVDIRALAVRALRHAGYKVVEATSGADALLLMEDIGARVDLVLTDVVMPRMAGGELAARLRERFPHVRMLLMSGFATGALDGGDVKLPLVAKPFTPKQLLAAVANALA